MSSSVQAPEGGQTVFVRKASGLVKSWAPFDAWIYSFSCISPAAGLFIFSSAAAYMMGGSMFWAAIIATAFVLLEVVSYAGLITAMPRAGGDYLWQTRIFNSPTGTIVAATGWWFVMWHWIPLFAIVNLVLFVEPLFALVGLNGVSNWMATQNGVFVSCVASILIGALAVATGMKTGKYVFRYIFYLGVGGFIVVLLVLLFSSRANFVSSVNTWASHVYGVKGVYGATLKAAGAGQPNSFLQGSFGQTVRLIPYLLFWMLWPNWGATLVGEVRGAKDYRKNVYVMGGALLLTVGLCCAFFVMVSHTMGYRFYMASGSSYWNGTSPLHGQLMSPVAMAASIVHNTALQFILIASMLGLALAWNMTAQLSSTRVIFAMAFDRVLPKQVASVTHNGVPWVAMLLMVIPSIVISAFYAYTSWFARLSLDATLMCAVTFLVTSLAMVVMPWRMKSLYRTTPMAKWYLGPIPVLSVVAAGFAAFLVAVIFLWLKDAVYGVNDKKSLIYLGVLYGAAIIVWVVAYLVRRGQGLPLEATVREIPEDVAESA